MKPRHVIILVLVIAGILYLLHIGRTRDGDEATAVATAVAVAVPAPTKRIDRTSVTADGPAKRIDAAFRQQSGSRYAPQPGDNRGTKQVKRVEAALIQRFLETAPVAEHELSRLMELLLKRESPVSAAEKATADFEIRRMVGDEYFPEIENSSRRVNVRLYAIEFIGEALWRGEPLTAEQREALNGVIAQVDKLKTVDASKPAAPGSEMREYDLLVLDAARGVLSPPQMSILKEVRTEIAKAGEE